MELLAEDSPLDLDDPTWPLRTRGGGSAPARLAAGAEVTDSLVSSGGRLAGTVEHSVLSRGVVVERGALVRDSVLLPGAVVRSGAVIERTVVDDAVEIGPDCRVGGRSAVTLVGRRARLAPGTQLAAGSRHPTSSD